MNYMTQMEGMYQQSVKLWKIVEVKHLIMSWVATTILYYKQLINTSSRCQAMNN
jgi:hypothetical protein